VPHDVNEALSEESGFGFGSRGGGVVLDPLVALSTAVAAKAWVWSLAWAGGLLLICVLFPRGFCGYLCPLGTLIDLFDWAIGRRVNRWKLKDGEHDRRWWVHLKYYLLLACLVAALGGVLITGFFAAIPIAFELGQKAQMDRDVGQGSLFGPALAGDAPMRYPAAEPWSDKVLLEAEKDCLGFYVSGHPLDRYEKDLHLYTTHDCRSVERTAERDEVRMGGIVAGLREPPGDQSADRAGAVNAYFHGAILAFEEMLPCSPS